MTKQTTPPIPDSVSGLILAGGRGLRMGGVDKGLLLEGGKPLVAHAIERLLPQVDKLMINANRNRDSYERWTYPVIEDVLPEFPGPLAGLHTGLLACDTGLLVTIPCDVPEFPRNLVARFRQTLKAHPVAPVTWAIAPDGEHPVFLLCKKTLLPALENYLGQGKRRVRDFLREVGGVPTHFEDRAAFKNLNTPEALDRDQPAA
jgi:molybdopterin-guanine dinucleotide biosynthesis protein A